MSVVVYSDDEELRYQLLGGALGVSRGKGLQVVCVTDENPEGCLEHGAEVVYHLKGEAGRVEELVGEVEKMAQESNAQLILVGSTKRGKEFAPALAERLNAGCLTDCVSLEVSDVVTVQRFTYGGSILARETCRGSPVVVTIPPRVFQAVETRPEGGRIIEVEVGKAESRVRLVERREKARGGQNLENAEIIVSVGRGLKAKEDLAMVEELAEALGGASIGCTRPVSADLGWLNEWVGISGKKVSPRLYIACGISGQVQHLSGIRDSKIVVSINKDESAIMNKSSDYVVVGDLYEVVPALVRALRAA